MGSASICYLHPFDSTLLQNGLCDHLSRRIPLLISGVGIYMNVCGFGSLNPKDLVEKAAEIEKFEKSFQKFKNELFQEIEKKNLISEKEIEEKSPEFYLNFSKLLILKVINSEDFDLNLFLTHFKLKCSLDELESCRKFYNSLTDDSKEIIIKILLKDEVEFADLEQRDRIKRLVSRVNQLTYECINQPTFYKNLNN